MNRARSAGTPSGVRSPESGIRGREPAEQELRRHFKTSRFIWTALVTFYFLVFFRNFLADAAPAQMAIPLVFAFAFVLWLAVEYYFGSPFFQSGVVEPSAFWRGVFAFFVYPWLGCLAADFIWWHRTQIPVPPIVTGILGLAVFVFGTYMRLETLFGFLNIQQVRPAQPGKGKPAVEQIVIPERKYIALRFQRLTRHPRYVATFIQLIGAALVFRSWGGLVLALAVGLPLILIQVRGEDRGLRDVLKTELDNYIQTVPLFWPRRPA